MEIHQEVPSVGPYLYDSPEEGSPIRVSIFDRCLQAHKEVTAATEQACREPLARLAELSAEALRAGGKLLFFGNGGSASDAQHLATELSIRFERDRRALAAISLATDTSALTACGNDFGFDRIFSRQLEALGRPGDVAIGISTSGNSPNVLAALRVAREAGITAAAFAGRDGGQLRELADPLIIVPAQETARIQEMHILLGHILCAEIEHRLGVA
jgi:D-sedoheptulose 7-phosphate isomerase